MFRALSIAAVLVLIGALAIMVWVRSLQGPGPTRGTTDLRFREITLDHVQTGDLDSSLPFMGMSAIDVDGDGIDELFIGGGHGADDAVFRFSEGAFQRASDVTGFHKDENDMTFGSASVDATGNGLDDLFVARESGVYFCSNQGSGRFLQDRIQFGLAENTTPLSIALGDIDQDGDVDLYVSGYIRADLMEGETNFDATYGGHSYLLRNEGDNVFVDATAECGVQRQHNTFTAMFIDLDNDTWPDLTVAQDTGVVETWRNQRDGTFVRTENPSVYSYPMGIGAGDIDNDGDVDLYFSNVGPTLPSALVRGNLEKTQPLNTDYMLFRNDGAMAFTDIAQQVGVAKIGFGWGVLMCDFNNDSRLDLYVAQNYAKFPGVQFLDLYPGRLLQQGADGQFTSVEGAAGIENKNFGITQVVSDFNQDGWQDIVLGNLKGETRAFLNQGGERSWLAVSLPSGPTSLNSTVVVKLPDGSSLTRQLFASQSLASDQTDVVHFGLGDERGPVTVTVIPAGGRRPRTYERVAINQQFTAGP